MTFPFSTIGHSNRGFDEFVALLAGPGVGLVMDIRKVPRSSRSFWRSFAGLSFHSCGTLPALMSVFSASVLRCLGAATMVASANGSKPASPQQKHAAKSSAVRLVSDQIRSARIEGHGAERRGPELPLDRSRSRHQQEHRHRTTTQIELTMVIVTHEMAFAREVADKVVFMRDGLIVEEGPANAVIDRPENAATRSFLAHFHRKENA